MTLKEAIEHARKKAKELGDCECARGHAQLAEWLEELQALKSPESETETWWLARDYDNELYMFDLKPVLASNGIYTNVYGSSIELPEESFPSIAPKKCYKAKITITPIEE